MNTLSLAFDHPSTPYKPYWKRCITAGRAAEGLRADWRKQFITLQREIGFETIRFHGLFHEDMMIYREENGAPIYNWQYLDDLFDFLLSTGARPLLELSFMPYALASGEGTVFWWKGNCTPPKDYARWAELVAQTIRHCINRYGLDEVLQWYFEVWNEPNLHNGFWFAGMADYFKLYEVTARVIKAIHPGLRVGGPASSDSGGVRAPWVDEFIAFCAENMLPVDFISTHPYPNLWPLDGYGETRMAYRDESSTQVDLQRIRAAVDASPFPQAEIHLTEWNSSPSPRDLVHDTAFMAPFVIQNNLRGLGLVDSLGFWTFTDVFEEGRAGDTIFHGGFGLINGQGLKKASYYGYWFLSRLGAQRVAAGPDYFVARKGETLQILIWNYAHYHERFAHGDRSDLSAQDRYRIFIDKPPTEYQLVITGLPPRCKVTEYRFDRQHGSAFDAWLAMGAPAAPTQEELAYLSRQVGPALWVSTQAQGDAGGGEDVYRREIAVPVHGVTLIEIQKCY